MTIAQFDSRCSLSFFLQDFFSDFSKQCPCVLSRSILQLIFLPYANKKVFGNEMLPDVLKDCIRIFVCPPVLAVKSPLYNNPHAKEMVDALLLHAVRVSTK